MAKLKEWKKAGGKTLGLSGKALQTGKRAGGGKISAVERKRAGVIRDIGQTKFVRGQGVVGPGGKAFTGTVIGAGGVSASYVRGKRVVASAKAKAPKRTSRPAPAKPPVGSGKPKYSKKQEGAQGARGGFMPKQTGFPKGGTRKEADQGGLSLTITATPWDKKKKGWKKTYPVKPYGIYGPS